MEKVGDERLARETERLFEYLEEEENKKQTKASPEAAPAMEENKEQTKAASEASPSEKYKKKPRRRLPDWMLQNKKGSGSAQHFFFFI